MNCLLSFNNDTLNGEQRYEFGFFTNYESMSLKQYIAQKTVLDLESTKKPLK